mgnify:CR=1 FL=1
MMFEKLCLIVSQLATCITAWWMFHSILPESSRKRWLTFTGMILYMLLPAHDNIVRQNRDWTQIMIWMLVPFLTVMLWRMKRAVKWTGRLGYGTLAAAAMGIIGRKDGIAGLILLFLLMIAGICEKQWQYPVTGILGVLLAYPTYRTWKHWLFDGAFAESGLEYKSIMEEGYSIGGLFSTYFHRGAHPGMGILLLGCLLFLLYNSLVKGRKLCTGKDYLWLGAAVLLTVMSLRYFPWDYVERLGIWALGLVSLLRTPAVFFGYAQMVLCVWSVEKCDAVLQMAGENKRNEGVEGSNVEENSRDLAG